MPLENFGSILNFAEELELQDLGFYKTLVDNPACADHKPMFEAFAAAIDKNVKTVQRTRRENVTEMILEPIRDFIRAPFCEMRGCGQNECSRSTGCGAAIGRSGGSLLHRSGNKNQSPARGCPGLKAPRQKAFSPHCQTR
jgi:hypothetical protein